MSTQPVKEKALGTIPETSVGKPVTPTPIETSVGKIAARVFLVLAIILAPFTLGGSLILAGVVYLIYTQCCQKTKKIDAVANAQLQGINKDLSKIDSSYANSRFNPVNSKEFNNRINILETRMLDNEEKSKKICDTFSELSSYINNQKNSPLPPAKIKEMRNEVIELKSKIVILINSIKGNISMLNELSQIEKINSIVMIQNKCIDELQKLYQMCDRLLTQGRLTGSI